MKIFLTLILSLVIAASMAPGTNAVTPARSTDILKAVSSNDLDISSEKVEKTGAPGKEIIVHSVNVEVRYGNYHIKADKVTVYRSSGKLVATGHVIIEDGKNPAITKNRFTLNI